MEFTRATARAMHDDHMAALALLGRVEQALAQSPGQTPPDSNQSEWRRLLGDFRAAVDDEITEHFAFEEEALFPIMNEAGAEDMSRLLMDQHKVLLPLGVRLSVIAAEAGRDGFSAATWAEFRASAGEFIDGLRGHIDMEEMGLVPTLEEVLEEDQDTQLIQAYKFT
jgi:hemerythrin-like domain-containing protein